MFCKFDQTLHQRVALPLNTLRFKALSDGSGYLFSLSNTDITTLQCPSKHIQCRNTLTFRVGLAKILFSVALFSHNPHDPHGMHVTRRLTVSLFISG